MQQTTTYADFGIEKQRPDSKGNIAELLVHQRNADNSMSKLGWYSREAIVKHIDEDGQKYMTIKISGTWSKGADVHVVRVNGKKYLRTDKNNIAADNLGNLPEG